MTTFRRRREHRKAERLARALAQLDTHARSARPAPKRVSRLSLGSARP